MKSYFYVCSKRKQSYFLNRTSYVNKFVFSLTKIDLRRHHRKYFDCFSFLIWGCAFSKSFMHLYCFWLTYKIVRVFLILWHKNNLEEWSIFRMQGIVFLLDCAFYNRRVQYHSSTSKSCKTKAIKMITRKNGW